tara:strand:+ start:161 stop:643 length:483 start_codon:yes stop_codon:yes gene_type:complete
MGKGNAAIKGQMIVENHVTGETMRVPLGAPRARQWGTPEAATQYLRSLVGADHAEMLGDIRVNDVPIEACHNLASMRQQGGIMNVTAAVLAPQPPIQEEHLVEEEIPGNAGVAPMETEIEGLAVKLAAAEPEAVAQAEPDLAQMTPLERMLAVPQDQWLY